MLVLSRKKNQVVKLGANIEVHVVEVRGGRVRLGFVAPSELPIERDDAKTRPAPAESH